MDADTYLHTYIHSGRSMGVERAEEDEDTTEGVGEDTHTCTYGHIEGGEGEYASSHREIQQGRGQETTHFPISSLGPVPILTEIAGVLDVFEGDDV